MKKFLLSIIILFSLTACSSSDIKVKVKPLKRPDLNIVIQKPLKLETLRFYVQIQNGAPGYCLDTQNYSNLSGNMEIIQNYLDMQRVIIESQKQYYEK